MRRRGLTEKGTQKAILATANFTNDLLDPVSHLVANRVNAEPPRKSVATKPSASSGALVPYRTKKTIQKQSSLPEGVIPDHSFILKPKDKTMQCVVESSINSTESEEVDLRD